MLREVTELSDSALALSALEDEIIKVEGEISRLETRRRALYASRSKIWTHLNDVSSIQKMVEYRPMFDMRSFI